MKITLRCCISKPLNQCPYQINFIALIHPVQGTIQSSEELSSRNAKDKKTETTKNKGKTTKKHGSPANVAKTFYRQTVSWSSWTRNGWNVLVDWRLCSCQRRSPSQSQFSWQWSSLQPSLHQLVLLSTRSPSLSLNRPTYHHSPTTDQATGYSAACSPV